MHSLKKIILLTAALSLNIQAVCSEGQQQKHQPTKVAAYCSVLHCWQPVNCREHIGENFVENFDPADWLIYDKINPLNLYAKNDPRRGDLIYIDCSDMNGGVTYNKKYYLLTIAQTQVLWEQVKTMPTTPAPQPQTLSPFLQTEFCR